jgi:drug/metabolite transporter (DMT)-like permease
LKNRNLPNNFILLLILSAIWGSSFLAIKISIQSLDPITVASGRLVIASSVLYIYYKIKKIEFSPDIKTISIIILIGFIGNFIPFFLIGWSEKFIQSNTAGLLMSVAPIFALILAHFMTYDDKFTFQKLFAIIIGLVGVLFIFGIDTLAALFTKNYFVFLPKLTVMLATLGYVLSSILAYNLKNTNTIALATFVTISAAIISIPFVAFNEIYNNKLPTYNSRLALLYLGIFPTAIAFLIRFYIISRAGPVFLSFVSYLIPGFAILWGYIFLNETITISVAIGLVFILFGIFLSQKYTNVKNN